MSGPHSVTTVWLDHQQARVFFLELSAVPEEAHCEPAQVIVNEPIQGNDARREGAVVYYQLVAKALLGTQAILVLGPSIAKFEFLRYAQRFDHALELRVAGVETLDHPTDRQIVDYARKHFKPS